MSKIKMFALGGLNENGKNMYVVNVDDDIFVFDAGLKYPDDKMFGIDYIIPNFDYLKENEKNIKGIFLTHGHDESIGAVPEIIKEIPSIKIYGTKFTLEVLKRELQKEKIKSDNLIELKPHKKIIFGENSVFPVSVTHSIPDSVLYVLNTKDGSIVYTGDFVFDGEASNFYKADIGKIAYIGKQGVLCLMSESLYSEKKGHTSPKHRISPVIRETLAKCKGRLIFNVTSTEVYRIQELFDEVSKTNKKIIIMGKRPQEIITKAIENKYVSLNKNKLGDISNLNDENVVILVSDEREKPFGNMSRIVAGYDKFVKIKETDTVLFSEPIKEGLEKTATKLANEIAQMGANIIELSSKEYLEHHASKEDLLLMINLLDPKYYMPVRGEYRYQFQNAELGLKNGINKNNILLKRNGDVTIFQNGRISDAVEKVKTDDILVDGIISGDIGKVVLKDREMLSDNGIFIVSATLDYKTKKIVSGPLILTRGFIYVKDNAELIKEAEKISKEVINNNIENNKIDFNSLKNEMRDKLSRYLYKETKCKPMILTVIQDV